MVTSRILTSIACLLVFQVCRIQSQAVSAESYSSATSISGPSQYGCGGGQIIIPAVITPVMSEAVSSSAAGPYVPTYNGGYGSPCPMPPIIIEEGGNGKNDLFLPLILILALRNNGGGCGNSNNGCSGFTYPAPYYGYGCGFGNNGCGYNYPYNSCGCNDFSSGCGYDCSNNTPTVNIVVSSADSGTTTT